MGKNNIRSKIVGIHTSRLITDELWGLSVIKEKEIQIVTTINSRETYSCTKCKMIGIPSRLLFAKKDENYHLVKSAISSGGSRFCGPIVEEHKDVKK